MEGNNPKGAVNKGPWKPDEDHRLRSYIEEHGPGNWSALPKAAGLNRCGKSCRLRWVNYLSPHVKRGNFKPEEDRTIINLHKEWGNQWARIASNLPGRTDNEIKNVWNARLKKMAMKLEARKNRGKDPKMEGSVSTTCACREKALGDQVFQELQITKPEENLFKTSGSFSKRDDEIMLDLPESQNQDLLKDQETCLDGEGKIEISVGSDCMKNQDYRPCFFWELNSLEPLQVINGEVQAQVENVEAQGQNPSNKAKKFDEEPEYKEWLKYMENFELEAASDSGNLPNKEDEKVHLEPKSTFDDDLEWYMNIPGSPGNPFAKNHK